jgi:hypothetical protein
MYVCSLYNCRWLTNCNQGDKKYYEKCIYINNCFLRKIANFFVRKKVKIAKIVIRTLTPIRSTFSASPWSNFWRRTSNSGSRRACCRGTYIALLFFNKKTTFLSFLLMEAQPKNTLITPPQVWKWLL